MKNRLCGIFVILIALFLGFYVGGWQLFCLPIAKIIESIKEGIVAKDIAVALFKIFVCTPVATIAAWCLGLCGLTMLVD